MKNCLFLVIFLLVISCTNKNAESKSSDIVKTNVDKKPLKKENKAEREDLKEIFTNTEIFIDSTTIAKKEKYKIEITQTTFDTVTKVSFILFEKYKNKWKNVQEYSLNKESDIPLSTEIMDFNNDGLNDFTIHYLEAARGSNDVRKLFIFSKKENKFIEIKNSDDYSNLDYNKKLNCIDDLEVYAGSTTTFLKLNKDILVEFARVDFLDGEAKSYLIQNNKETKLHSEKFKGSNDIIVRFVNYDPIEE